MHSAYPDMPARDSTDPFRYVVIICLDLHCCDHTNMTNKLFAIILYVVVSCTWKEISPRVRFAGAIAITRKHHMNHIDTTTLICRVYHGVAVPYGVLQLLVQQWAALVAATKHRTLPTPIVSTRRRTVCPHPHRSTTIPWRQTAICPATTMRYKHDTTALHRRCTRLFGRHQVVVDPPHKLHFSAAYGV